MEARKGPLAVSWDSGCLGPALRALESGHWASTLPASKSRHAVWWWWWCASQGRCPWRGEAQGVGGQPLSMSALFLDFLGGAVHRGSSGRAHLRLHPGPAQQRPHGPREGVDQRPGRGVRPGWRRHQLEGGDEAQIERPWPGHPRGGGAGAGGGRGGENPVTDILTSWPTSLPKGPPDLRGQAWFGTVSITFFLFLCFLASGLPGDQDLSITHSLEVMEEVKERDLPC